MDSSRTRAAFILRLGGEWLLSLFLALAILFVVEAQSFGGDAWKFPTAVGALTAVLAAMELLRSLRSKAVVQDAPEGAGRSELAIGVWFVATLIGVYVLGLLTAIALSAAVFFYLFVRPALLVSIAAGLGHALFFWVAFELLAGFRLYGGVF